ncbi:MAG: hypothetical protein QM767_09820 [Anaeromyxobacter sp.]
MNRIVLAALLLTATIGTGCTHAMRITNLDEFRPAPTAPLQPARTVGLTSRNLSDPASRRYIDAIADGLRRDATYDRVLYPCDGAQQKDVDVVYDISVVPTYGAQGTNFFVNWPGFLIFAPAIWGYGYTADLQTSVAIRTRDGATQQLQLPAKFTFRQAEFDRTWTEIGWLEIGIIPLIGGMAFTQYDPDVTQEFQTRVAPDYGSYVAQRAREALAAMPPGAPPPAPPAPAAAAAPAAPAAVPNS